jgi:hypothetical protein
MSFGTDKYQVYEDIVNLQLNRGDKHSAFDYVERSKSRTLIDLLEETWTASGMPERKARRLLKIRKLREELNVLYNRLDSDMPNTRAPVSSNATRNEIISRERELMETLRDAGSESMGWATCRACNWRECWMFNPCSIRRIAERRVLLGGDRFQAIVIGKSEFQVLRDLTTSGEIRARLSKA